MKSSVCIVASAVLVSVALVVAANIMCRQQTVKEESYRYQFIKSERYRQFTVFDRKTGIVYQFGQSDGEEMSLVVDLPRAEMLFKPFSNFWPSDSEAEQ